MEVAPPPQKRLYMANMAFMANMTTTARWLNFKMTGCLMAVLGCTDVCWTALGFAGLYWAVNVVQVIQVIYVVTGQVGRVDQSGQVARGGPGGTGGPGGRVVRIVSPDDMHSENMWLLWSKPSNYQEKMRCHARDDGTDGGGWKMENRAETTTKS